MIFCKRLLGILLAVTFSACCFCFIRTVPIALTASNESVIVHEFPQECEIPADAYGVWQIPELCTITPVYYGAENEQLHIDAEDSAAIMPFRRGYWIGDHAGSVTNNGRGVWEMNKVHVNGVAFMVLPEKTEQYICYMICKAAATGYGYTLDGYGLYPLRSGDIICGSCANADGSQVYLAFYRYVCDFS